MALNVRARLTLMTACAALAGASGAKAAVFAVVRSAPDVITVIDPATIQAVGATAVRRAWSISVKRNLVSGGPQQPGYIRTLNEYDCAERRMRWKTFSVYSRFGVLVMKKDNDDAAWNPTPDAGEDGAGMRVACEGGANSAVVSAQSVSKLVLGLMQAWDEAAPLPPLQTGDPKPPAKNARKPEATAKPAPAATKKSASKPGAKPSSGRKSS